MAGIMQEHGSCMVHIRVLEWHDLYKNAGVVGHV